MLHYLSDNYFLYFSCRAPSLTRGRVADRPHFKASGTRSPPLHDRRTHVAQGTMAWTCLHKTSYKYMAFLSTHPSARCVSNIHRTDHTLPSSAPLQAI
jgi:hypothetical protein